MAKKLNKKKRSWSSIRKGFTHVADGDVVVAKITPCFQNGKSAVLRNLVNGVGAGTTELHVFRKYGDTINPDYVLIYVKSSQYLKYGEARMTGSAGQKRVPTEYFSYNPFPLPPLKEQYRIVSKVVDLLSLCDEIETRQHKAQQSRIFLNSSALDHLANARGKKEFSKHWNLITKNFDALYEVPETVGKLRQTILQLAVQGNLVKQYPNDEPATVLLEKIKTEKEKLIKKRRSGR